MAMGGFFGFLMPRQSKVWHKLAVVVVSLAVPAAMGAYLLVSINTERSAFARKELAGAELLQPTRKLFADLVDYRQLVASQAAKPEQQRKQDDLLADIKLVMKPSFVMKAGVVCKP